MDLHPDFRDLLGEFVRAGVRFAILGGYAVGIHGRPRATKDLDLLLEGSPENLQRAARALEVFGAPPNVVQHVRTLGPEEVAFLGVPPVRVDLLRTVDGLQTAEVLARAISLEIDGLRLPVIALDDLLTNKRAAGRPQDLADAAALERIRAAGRP